MRCEPHWQGELANLEMRKLANVEGWGVRKETEKNGRELRGILVRKCYEEGGGSL